MPNNISFKLRYSCPRQCRWRERICFFSLHACTRFTPPPPPPRAILSMSRVPTVRVTSSWGHSTLSTAVETGCDQGYSVPRRWDNPARGRHQWTVHPAAHPESDDRISYGCIHALVPFYPHGQLGIPPPPRQSKGKTEVACPSGRPTVHQSHLWSGLWPSERMVPSASFWAQSLSRLFINCH